jgi:hypothetical protein
MVEDEFVAWFNAEFCMGRLPFNFDALPRVLIAQMRKRKGRCGPPFKIY